MMPDARERPNVWINVAMSADGKISTHRRETFSLGSRHDRYLMDLLRAKADAVIVGARTVRLDGWAIRVRDLRVRRRRVAGGKPPHPLNVVLSSRLDLSVKCQFFDHPKTEKLIITSRLAPRSRIRRFAHYGDVWVAPSTRIRPAVVLNELHKRGCKRVLLEGGGELNFSFLAEGLVDELYITITPRILGGRTAPTPVDGPGFLRATQLGLELISSRRRGEEVFLRYRVRPRS
jgi:2,5-diamino-6-(ribosylamino)-4(3H)-pyrimidinone 5'-phosphate reductase